MFDGVLTFMSATCFQLGQRQIKTGKVVRNIPLETGDRVAGLERVTSHDFVKHNCINDDMSSGTLPVSSQMTAFHIYLHYCRIPTVGLRVSCTSRGM